MVVWVGIALVSGEHEAWDHPGYWKYGYPLMVVVSGLLGWLFPRRAWQQGLAMMLSQLVPLLIVHPLGPLLPLGVIFLAVLALPAMLAAQLAAVIRRRWAGPGQTMR